MDEVGVSIFRAGRRTFCRALLAGSAAYLAACAAAIGQDTALSGTDRAAVQEFLQRLTRALRNSGSEAERLFSRNYEDGYEDQRDKLVQSRRAERITEIQYFVNRILESDGRLNVQVRWNKAYVDAKGAPGRRSGTSEMILERAGESFRIVAIRGDKFL